MEHYSFRRKMDRGRKKNNKNNKASTRKSSGREYLKKMNFQNIDVKNPEEFLHQTTLNMKELDKEVVANPLDNSKRRDVEGRLQPMDVTLEVKRKIQNIPRSKAVSWYIDLNPKIEVDAVFLYCNIHLVDEENIVDDKTRLVTCIGVSMCVIKSRQRGLMFTRDVKLKEKDIIMGTFAKTCLQPDTAVALKGLSQGQQGILPAEVILNTSGLVDTVKLDLMELGVSRVINDDVESYMQSIAHSNLILEGKKCFKKTFINTRPYHLVDKRAKVKTLATKHATKLLYQKHENSDYINDYVSEEMQNLQGWVPPCIAPTHWFAKKPELNTPTRIIHLWGWRTNLQSAVENVDESKVIEITSERCAEDVREFCEIICLLRSMAFKGMKESCRLLIDYCSVSVEGAQLTDIPDEWMFYMKFIGQAGNCRDNRTPLMAAAYEGYYDACELLLDRNADVNAVSTDGLGVTALRNASVMGHKDVVKLLCKRNADISQKDGNGYDVIDLIQHILDRGEGLYTRCTMQQYQKIVEILHEYDTRCSFCKNRLGILRQCPCHKERYCDGHCQMQRWHCHKALHKKIMEKKK